MRYVFGFLCVCALGVVPVVGCTWDLVPDEPPLPPDKCEGVVCEDDGNACTIDCNPANGRCEYVPARYGAPCDFDGVAGICNSGVCEQSPCVGLDCSDGNDCTEDYCNVFVPGFCSSLPLPDWTVCDFDGLAGRCISGVCVEDRCEGVDCDDGNDCTQDGCDFETGTCEHPPFGDGYACSDGVCLDGICSTVVDQCTAKDLAAIEAGDEPEADEIVECMERAGDIECFNSIANCLWDSGTTLSRPCSDCFAIKACCTLNQCECPYWAPDCDPPCIQNICQPQVDVCIGGQ